MVPGNFAFFLDHNYEGYKLVHLLLARKKLILFIPHTFTYVYPLYKESSFLKMLLSTKTLKNHLKLKLVEKNVLRKYLILAIT